jgi:hypothetical protein
MAQFYSDPERENDAWALPDVEVFYAWEGELEWEGQEEPSEEGWYYWFCLPGCMPDSDPIGPFETEAEAINDAKESE